MAKHLAKDSGNQKRQRRAAKGFSFRFGAAKLPELPRLFPQRTRKANVNIRYERSFSLRQMAPVLASALLFVAACFLPAEGWARLLGFALAALASGYVLLLRLGRRVMLRKLPNEDLLILLSVVLSFVCGNYAAGAIAMILFRACELLEAFVLAGGEAAMESFRNLLPEKALKESEDGPQLVLPESLAVGDVIRVLPHEIFPVDAQVLRGSSEMALEPLTGSEETLAIAKGDTVYAGCENLSGELLVQVTRPFEDCAMAIRLKTLGHACRSRTELERQGSRAAAVAMLCLAALALLLALVPPIRGGAWMKWLSRSAVLLFLASPSALILSVPLAFRGAIQGAALRGVVIREQETACALARTRTMVFGKTGTITAGVYTITELCPDGVDAQRMLRVAAAAESRSEHPIARALKQAAGWTEASAAGLQEVEELPGRGVSALIEGHRVYVGNAALLEENGVWYQVPNRTGAAIHVAVDQVYWGYILVSDKPRDNAFDALEELRIQGVSSTVMLTGDVLSVSRPIAASLNFDMVKAELSLEGKLSAVDYLTASLQNRAKLAYVGDGIHDAVLMERADLGIMINALLAENRVSAADVAILGNDILSLPAAMRFCGAAYRRARINAYTMGAAKLIMLVLSALGLLPLFGAALAELALTGFMMFNALRVYGVE